MSGELIGGAVGGFVTGFGAAGALVNILISRALAQFRSQLGTGEDGFITRREAHLLMRRPGRAQEEN